MNLRCTIVIALLLLFVNGYTQTPANDTPLTLTQQMPEYPGGKDSLMYDILSKVVYPKACADSSIQGKVYIRFVVNRDGSASDFEVIKTPHPLLGDAAVQAARSIKKFSPGMQDGKPARVWVSVPVMFKIKVQEVIPPPDLANLVPITDPAMLKELEEAAKDIPDMASETPPQFPGGDNEFVHFLQRNISYPELERDNDIQGKVHVRFIVTETGAIDSVVVVKGVSPGLDNEAVRIIKMMPRFTPGTYAGKPIRVYFNMPIVFKLDSYGFDGEERVYLFDYFPGNYDAFSKAIYKEMVYPEKAKTKLLEGLIDVKCKINAAGKLEPVGIRNDPDSIFTAEAIRIINALPAFKSTIAQTDFVKGIHIITISFIMNPAHRWNGNRFADSNESERLNGKANDLFSEGKYEKALEYYDAALKYYSTNSEAMYNRGVTYSKLNRSNEACDDFKRAYLLGDYDALAAIKQTCK